MNRVVRTLPVQGGLLGAALLLTGCPSDVDPPDLLDTGWFEEEDAPVCRARVETTEPADGAVDWYWRAPLKVFVSEPAETYGLRVVDENGRGIPADVEADDTGLVYTITPTDGLPWSTSFRLLVDDCEGPREVAFATSPLGEPLIGGAATLRGRTWQLDLENATWEEPAGFSTVLSTLAYNPVLVGVAYVDADNLDWIGAQGNIEAGKVVQDPVEPTWDFPLSDFSGSPYFATSADEVTLAIQGHVLPITGFEITGTFAADGTGFGGGTLVGLGDTRDLGPVLGQGANAGAFCDLAESLGIDCEPCPDQRPFCLGVVLSDLEGVEVDGLSLVPVKEDG